SVTSTSAPAPARMPITVYGCEAACPACTTSLALAGTMRTLESTCPPVGAPPSSPPDDEPNDGPSSPALASGFVVGSGAEFSPPPQPLTSEAEQAAVTAATSKTFNRMPIFYARNPLRKRLTDRNLPMSSWAYVCPVRR